MDRRAMANVLIVGGGFGGVLAAESLAKKLGSDHQITLVSRSRRFLFYPALVRFAFGQYHVEDISFDLREAMLDREFVSSKAKSRESIPTNATSRLRTAILLEKCRTTSWFWHWVGD